VRLHSRANLEGIPFRRQPSEPFVPEIQPNDVTIEEKTTLSDGYLTVSRYRLRHELYAGGMGASLLREVVERGATAAVLPYDPVHDKVLLIEQFRPGAYVGGGNPWLKEIVAGVIEPGETAEDVARREAVEESALALHDLLPIANIFLTPGICSEQCQIFCAVCDLAGAGGLHGHRGEGEDIKATVYDFADVEAMVRAGSLSNAITMVALQWLLLNRPTLQAAKG
jgi:ADP-ribose pyrophosphatase